MARAEFAQPNRQIMVRRHLLAHQLNVRRTTYRLECERALACVEHEQVIAKFAPVSAALPNRLRQELRGTHFAKTGAPHLAADVVLDHAVENCAARMPEGRAGRVLLMMKQVEPRPEHAVVV